MNNLEKSKKIDTLIFITIAMCILIIPIAVRAYEVSIISPKIMSNVYGTGFKVELFNYIKSVVLYTLTSIIFVLFVYKIIFLKQSIIKTSINIWLCILIIGIMISLVMCDYKYITLMGNVDRYEGVIAWACYCFLFFVIYNTEIDNIYFKLFYFILIPFLIINLILGLLNFYNINILNSKVVQLLIGANEQLNGSLWTTLYNPNFISGICGVIFIASTTYLLLEKNHKIKLINFILSIISFTIVLTSLSLSGFMTIVVLIPIVLLIACKFSDKKNIVIWFSTLLIFCTFIFSFLNSQNNRVWDNSIGFFVQASSTKVLSEGSVDFESVDKLSTGRIHIWKKTIELIKERPITGYGFDTLPYYMDHDDPRSNNVIIDKPHNWFLTVFYGAGLISLTGLIGIISCLTMGIFKSLKNGIEDKYIYISGAFVGGYVVQGMVNDSFIGTSIIFWIFAGLCANRLLLNRD